jgi:hypothetical protein
MNMNHHPPMPSPTPLCAIFEPQVALLSSGMLEMEQLESVHAHLAGCAYCQLQLREYQHLREDLLRLLLGGATASASTDSRPAATVADGGTAPGRAGEAPVRFTVEQIMRASAEEEMEAPQPPVHAPRMLELPPRRRLLSTLGAIAAVLVLTLLAASLFGSLRFLWTPAVAPTPTVHGPFSPYLAPAPGLPCDHNAQASTLWSGDNGICLTNPPRTRLVAQGRLAAVMRWDAGTYHLPDSYKISVQVTLGGASSANLQMESDLQNTAYVIACSSDRCAVDGKASEACACDTSGPLTLAIVVQGRNESFYAGSALLGSVTASPVFHPTSISLGVSASNPSAQGAQADFANFAVLAS